MPPVPPMPTKSPKAILNEWCQARAIAPPVYRIDDRSGPAHAPTFVVECDAAGYSIASEPASSLKEAEASAATAFLGAFVAGYQDLPSPARPAFDVTFVIDGDNVHEAEQWLAVNAPQSRVHVFVAAGTQSRGSRSVRHSVTTRPDATDLTIIIHVTRRAVSLDAGELVVVVSRDKIFETFVAELQDPRVVLAKDTTDLRQICADHGL